jgi:Tol biopolymer transport system component
MDEYRDTLERELDRLSPPKIHLDQLARRRDRKRRDERIRAGLVGLAIAIVIVGSLGIGAIRSTAPPPAEEPDDASGIFSSVGGWIVIDQGGVYRAVSPDGSDETALLEGRTELWPEDWSPDGSRLLVKRSRSLAVIEPDGSETTLVRYERYSFDGASFSPDGVTVVFAKWAGAGQLWTIASDGSGEPRLLLESEDLVYQPTYSPDGTRIAYVDGGGDHSHTIRVVNADGTRVRVLIDATPPFDGGHITGLEWSPDGSIIAIGLDGEGIYTIRPDGTDLRLLIPRAENPAWSPDGSLIAYSPYSGANQRAVWVANADGSDPRMLSPSGTAGPWNPGTPADRA